MKKLLLILVACLAFIGTAFAGQINLNTASEAELVTLSGVGPVKAKAIVDYRAKNGPFRSVEDLEKVPGFGKKTVEKLRGDLTVSGAAASAKAGGKSKKDEAAAKGVKADDKAIQKVEQKADKKADAKKGAAK